MSMQWTSDLATGNTDIDAQHQELFHRIGELEDACAHQRGADEVRRHLAYLMEYVELHFSAEEEQMRRLAFPRLSQHREQHHRFRGEILALNNEVSVSGARHTLIQATLMASVEWLVEHVKVADRELAAHMNECAR